MNLLLQISFESQSHGEHDSFNDKRQTQNETLDTLRQHGISTIVDQDVHESGEGKEEIDGGVSDVADVLRVLLRTGGDYGDHDAEAGQDELDDALPGQGEGAVGAGAEEGGALFGGGRGQTGALKVGQHHLSGPLPDQLEGPAEAQEAEDEAGEDVAGKVVHVLGREVGHLVGDEAAVPTVLGSQVMHLL